MALSRLKIILNRGHQRDVKVRKNIIISFLLKGVDMIIRYLRVPILLDFFSPTKYGIWLTLNSIIDWFGFLKIGLSTGLRNKLAEALTKEDYELSKTLVSTTYLVIIMIISIAFIFVMAVNPLLNWSQILNTEKILNREIQITVILIFTFFTLRFILSILDSIVLAFQDPSISDAFHTGGAILYFSGILISTQFIKDSLILNAILTGFATTIIYITATLVLFAKRYKKIAPSIRYIDFKHFRSLASLGLQFFIIQISVIIMFTTDNIIISQVSGPSDVVPYNIARRYFSIVTMIFITLLNPYWSAFTQAYVKKEMDWIRKTTKKIYKLWLLSVGIVIIMLFSSGFVFRIWIGDRVEIPFQLCVFMAFFIIIRAWNNIFAYLINGIGKIRLQLYFSIIISLINIPLSVYFARNLGFGISGVILATIACLLIGAVLTPIQYYKIINNKAAGIWNK